MRWKRPVLAVAILGILVGGCVSQKEFKAYKQGITKDGKAVEQWIGEAQQWFLWFDTNKNLWCPGGGCGTPPVPDPEPDGKWGGG